MKKSRLLSVACASLFAIISIPTEAVVIDFEGFLPADSAYVATPQDWEGFRFASSSAWFGTYTDGYTGTGSYLSSNGTTRMGVFDGTSNAVDEMTLTQVGGGGFMLNSLDVAFAASPSNPGIGLDIFITIVSGLTFQHHYALTTDWTTIVIPEYTLEMESILISQTGNALYGFALDNVAINAVPIPAAAWLFGSGMVGLIAMARRKKSV